MSSRKHLAILGSTGSIGRSTLDVVERCPGCFAVDVLAAHSNVERLVAQIRAHRPRVVAVAEPQAALALKRRLRAWKKAPAVWAGPEGVRRAAVYPSVQLVVSAMVGQAGLLPTLDAIRAGRDIALANKETLVVAGELVMREVKRHRVKLLPVDSEHAALAQCLKGHEGVEVRRLILTASGGPFREVPAARLRGMRAADALRHPTWSMGPKITVDSSTLMNKGLEVIEAHHLFNIDFSRIEVAVHPQSVVHSLVEFVDGSTLAQLASPDMRLPIQAALTHPAYAPALVKPLDFHQGMTLTFGAPDVKRFPCLGLAYAAGRRGGTAPAVLNAANEVAVGAFLRGELGFMEIPKLIQRVLSRHREAGPVTLERILRQDAWARKTAEEMLACKPCK
jgi:1-deoxy-D-xylulose-5-phosphate reductoisomerase